MISPMNSLAPTSRLIKVMSIKNNVNSAWLRAFCIGALYLLWGISAAYAQADLDCELVLKKAEQAYAEGRINEVAAILEACFKGDKFTREQKVRAYYIQTLSYLYLDEDKKADASMLELLRANPEYQVRNNEAKEFVTLYNTYDIRPQLVLGGRLGLSRSVVNLIRTFSLDNSNNPPRYTTASSFHIGGIVERPLNRYLSLVTELGLTNQSYQYQNTLFGYATVSFEERQNHLRLPILLKGYLGDKYNFRLRNFMLYGYAGPTISYLASALAVVSRNDFVNEDIQRQVAGLPVNISEQRKKLYYYATLGIGLEYKRGLGSLFADVRYDLGLQNIVRSEQRYENNELIFRYGYLDNDLSLSTFTFAVGYVYPIYKPKKKKQYRR